jgi:hypothetical protein
MSGRFNFAATVALTGSLVLGPIGFAAAATGSDIGTMCGEYPGGAEPNTCEAYIQAMVEIVDSSDNMSNPNGKLCVGDAPIGDLVNIVNKWLTAHPELLSKSAYDATYGAFAQAYKCK